MVVIGIGTGRCGTRSLARIINSQPNVEFTHELKPVLPWNFDQIQIDNRIEELQMSNAPIVGDAGFYYLNYVEYIISEIKNVRIVCLKRDKEGTVNSFLRKVKQRNHWQHHDGTKWQKDKRWDKAFPKYEANSRREAIAMYWEDYYTKVSELVQKYPDHIKYMRTKELNEEPKVRAMLEFCGVSNPQPVTIHTNKEK